MNEVVDGIVLSQTDARENDVIINVYTSEYGQLAFYGRGLKKMTSKNAYACQLFDYSEFLTDYNPNKSIQLLKSANLKKEYMGIKSDYDRIALGSIITEIISQLEDDTLMDLLMSTLDKLDGDEEPYLVFNLFVVEILNMLGITPVVDGCVSCGDTTHIETISLEDGGFLCHDCNKLSHLRPVDVKMLRKFRIINKASFAVYDKIRNMDMNDPQLTKYLMDFLIMHSGMNLKSYRSLSTLG